MPKARSKTKDVEVEVYSYDMLLSYFLGGICYAGSEDIIFKYFFSIKYKSDTGLDHHQLTFINHDVESQVMNPDDMIVIHKDKIYIMNRSEFKERFEMPGHRI